MKGIILKFTGTTKNIIKELLKDIDILGLEFDIQHWESYGDDMEGSNLDFNNTREISSEIIKNKLFIENNTLYPEFIELFARKENDSKKEIFNYKDFLESKYVFSIINYDYRNIEVCSKIPEILESIKIIFLNSDLKDKKIIELDHIPEDATLKSWRQGKGING